MREKPPSKPDRDHREDARFAQKLADAYGATVVLKGADTFIATTQAPHKGKDDIVRLMDRGTSVLARAGTGDVLSGMLASLLAQGMDAHEAAMLATSLHAEAGRVAAKRLTDVSTCASDVAESLPQAIKAFMEA